MLSELVILEKNRKPKKEKKLYMRGDQYDTKPALKYSEKDAHIEQTVKSSSRFTVGRKKQKIERTVRGEPSKSKFSILSITKTF